MFFVKREKKKKEKEKEEKKTHMPNVPMDQHPSSAIQPFLNKGIAAGKVLNDIFLVQIINADDEMLEREIRARVERRFHGGEEVSHVGPLEGFLIDG